MGQDAHRDGVPFNGAVFAVRLWDTALPPAAVAAVSAAMSAAATDTKVPIAARVTRCWG